MVTAKQPARWTPIQIQTKWGVITGSYSLDSRADWLRVRMDGGGEKGTHGGPAATTLAKIILGELARENRTEG